MPSGMKHFYLILFLVAGISVTTPAQTYKLSKDSADFIAGVKTMMAATKNDGAIQVATRLEAIWGSNQLSSSQRSQVMDIGQQMLAKKLKARPHFEHFFGALVSAIQVHKLGNASLDGYIQVVQRTLQAEPVTVFEKVLATSSAFLHTTVIYKSQNNALRASGGSFSFAYRDGTEVVPEKPVPAAPRKKTAADQQAGAGALSGQEEVKTEDPAAADPWAGGGMPVLLGPVTYLLLGKSRDAGVEPLSLLPDLLPA